MNGGMMRDLSEEGFAVRAMMALTSGKSTPFSFSLSESLRIEGKGEIVWVEDKGRVAGVRFTEISSQARKQIQNWLNEISDSQEEKESEEDPVAPTAQSFDQLREELRGSPPQPDPPKHEVIPDTRRPEETRANVPPLTAGEPWKAQEPEHPHPPEPIPFPGLPSFSLDQGAIEISFEPPAPANESLDKTSRSGAPARRIPLPVSPNEDVVARPRPPAGMPDISKILMQPSRKATNYTSRLPILEPLETPNQSRGMFEQSRTRAFTLSRAVTIMFLIACAVAVTVYHQTVGQGLIWLGEQIGGAQMNEIPAPAPNDGVANGDSTQPPSNPSDSAMQAPRSAALERSQENTNKETSHRSSGAQASLPSIAQNPPPPVTPLSGISSPPVSEPGQETGLTEYAKALQLLHGKDGGTNASEAVRLLWISVEKGNASAELTLAELYWHGEGVARNCDQTRILLSAAARKGNADAQKGLQQFQREGCE
jgi:hypothetical protein